MDSYIIRIYRRNGDDRNSITGVVEWAESEERRSFKHSDELVRILCGPEDKLQSGVEEEGNG